MKKICACILAGMVITGCSNNEGNDANNENASVSNPAEDSTSSTEPYTFSVDDQSFEIVPVYDEILNYTADMKEDPLDNDETFNEKVIQPMKDAMTEVDFASFQIGSEDYFRSTQQFEELEDLTQKLANQQDNYNKLLEEALRKSAEKLPGDDVSVYLIPAMPEEDIQEIRGIAVEEQNIVLKMSPIVTGVLLKNLIAHEYHHTVNEDTRTLLASVLTEGKAEYFASTLYSKGTIRDDLSEEEETNILKLLDDRARTSLHGWDYEALLFGSREKGIPYNAIYKIGLRILKNHLDQHPEESIEDWTEKSAEDIVKESDYRKLLEKTDIVDSNDDN